MAAGPYSAQIQAAIRNLLAGDNTWTGTNTFSGSVLTPTLTGVQSITFSGTQSLVGTTANVTTLANSTANQRFVLGLASNLYPALNRSTTGITMTLGDGTAGGFFTLPDGVVGAPSLLFATSGTTTGLWHASNIIHVSIGGADRNRFGTNTEALGGVYAADGFGWTTTIGATPDLWLKRNASGVFSLLGTASANVGVTLNVATDSTLKLFARDGSSAATLQMGTGSTWSGNNLTLATGGQAAASAFTAYATGSFQWVNQSTIKSPSNGAITVSNNDASALVTLNVAGASTGRLIQWGTGSPEGVVTASVGSLYLDIAGGASTTLYVKTSGTGNTGWTAK